MKKLISVGLLVSVCASPVLGRKLTRSASRQNERISVASQKADDRVTQVDALMAPWSKGATPGAAVLVVKDGRVLLKKGYGLASVDAKRPIAPDTVFDLASVSKQFTAMAILILVDRGKLSLDDPLTKFFPDFPAYAQKITVRHILNHTSGLPDYIEAFMSQGKIDKDWNTGGFEPSSSDVIRLLTVEKQGRFVPGEKFEYSNSGYVVLGQIVGKVAGMSLPQFLRENVFQPLGMKSTLVADESKPKIKNRAISYRLHDGKYLDIDYTPLNLIYGDGNVNTTIEDMYLWDQALYTEKLVKASTLKIAFTAGKLNDLKDTNYGFGWGIDNYGGQFVVTHSGGWAGFRTDIMRFPNERFTVVVLSNFARFQPSTIAKKIARIYLGDKLNLPVIVTLDPLILQKYVGEYELRPNLILTITLEDNILRLQATGQPKLSLAAKSEIDFYVEDLERIGMTFNKDEKGVVTSMTLHQNGDHPAKKIK